MSRSPAADTTVAGHTIGFREFVALMATVMGMHAAGVDTMLPALPEMGTALHIDTDNHRQWIVSAYLFGFGATQLLYGPIADRYGRRPVLLGGLLFYCFTSLIAGIAASFPLMLAARALQGAAGSASRVMILSIVRDRYAGATMARVMSLISMVFLLVPILAPTVGQLVMLVAPWRAIFLVLALYGAVALLWTWLRLPETLDMAHRRSIQPARILAGFGVVLGNRQSLGYTLVAMLNFGAILGYIMSSQQLFAEAFAAPGLFSLMFGLSAGGLAVAAFINSRIVELVGSRMVSHFALIGITFLSILHAGWALWGTESLSSFMIFLFPTMVCMGLTGSNCNALAMEPMGALAGTASSVQGTISTLGSSLIGVTIGQNYNGTALPVILGFLASGCLGLVAVLLIERGRLLGRHHD